MQYSLEQLQTFITAYELKSFKKAAIKLNKHRTTVGQVITNLEIHWGVTLFDRSARSVQITEEGKLLYHHAKQALEQARTLDKLALSLASTGLETLTIAYGSFVPQSILNTIYQTITDAFPNMRINLVVRSKSEVKQGIQSGQIHFALMNVHQAQMIHSIDSTFLGHISLIPVAGNHHEIHSLPNSERYPAMQSSKQMIMQAFIEDDLATRMIVSSQHDQIGEMSLLLKLVSEGHGWAILPKEAVQHSCYQKSIQKIELSGALNEMLIPMALWCPHSIQIAPDQSNTD